VWIRHSIHRAATAGLRLFSVSISRPPTASCCPRRTKGTDLELPNDLVFKADGSFSFTDFNFCTSLLGFLFRTGQVKPAPYLSGYPGAQELDLLAVDCLPCD